MHSQATRSPVLPEGVNVLRNVTPDCAAVLTPGVLAFIAKLHREFNPLRKKLLQRRVQRQTSLDAGVMPDFLPETRTLREGNWQVAPVPADLQNRRVEITGPTDRKMIINALNSGANVFMADFEDSNAPTWENMIQGQVNLRDAVNRCITYRGPEGKDYALAERTATLMVRPRGWHLAEKHVLVDGEPVAGGIFDFAVYFFYNAATLLQHGTGPYFYLPKLEDHREARLWNEVFQAAQDELRIPRGTIKATVLIEHILAAYQTHEIMHELRDHSAGLNCGRWDYIFSYIKKFREHPEFVLPDRAQVTMTSPFLQAYSLNVIKTCHQHGTHAIGGMAAHIPIKNNPAANEAALAKVRADKQREASDGHDGTWVAHPGLVPVAREAFDAAMPGDHQISLKRDDVQVTAADLIEVPRGDITETGLRTNVSVGVQYLESWLRGNGCVPLNHLMEDAATAEISRTQVWQWIRHPGGVLADGRRVTADLFRDILSEELERIKDSIGHGRFAASRFADAARVFHEITTSGELVEFLTLPAYEYLD